MHAEKRGGQVKLGKDIKKEKKKYPHVSMVTLLADVLSHTLAKCLGYQTFFRKWFFPRTLSGDQCLLHSLWNLDFFFQKAKNKTDLLELPCTLNSKKLKRKKKKIFHKYLCKHDRSMSMKVVCP